MTARPGACTIRHPCKRACSPLPIVVSAPLSAVTNDGSLAAAAKAHMAGEAAEPERSNK
jgi:hypothetical protein